jgi:hypothetical protein
MTDTPRIPGAKTRGRPFSPGNPGKPKGARNRITRALEALLEGEGEALTRKAVEMALAGDGVAMKMCLDRLLPALRERPMSIDLPPLSSPKDAVAATSTLLASVAGGEIAPGEARELGRLLELHIKALEVHELETRLAALEARQT